MNKLRFTGAVALVLILTLGGFGQGFRVYLGATKYVPPTNEETEQAKKNLPPGTTSTIYTTKDSFEQVTNFYKAIGKEYFMPGMPQARKLPNGQELKQTFFIFDGAPDLGSSKSWATLQRPFIGSATSKGGMPEYNDISDLTAITVELSCIFASDSGKS